MMTHTIIYQEWTEFERGWGQRPDGFSLHLCRDYHVKYLDEDKKSKYGTTVPDEYSSPTGSPIEVTVDDELFQEILTSKNIFGMRVFQWANKKYKLSVETFLKVIDEPEKTVKKVLDDKKKYHGAGSYMPPANMLPPAPPPSVIKKATRARKRKS